MSLGAMLSLNNGKVIVQLLQEIHPKRYFSLVSFGQYPLLTIHFHNIVTGQILMSTKGRTVKLVVLKSAAIDVQSVLWTLCLQLNCDSVR